MPGANQKQVRQSGLLVWRRTEAPSIAAHRRRRRRSTPLAASARALTLPTRNNPPKKQKISTVYKFGGSSVRDAERMREVADIVCHAEPHEWPLVVLSAMGKTTNLLLEAGELAVARAAAPGPDAVRTLAPLKQVRELHLQTCDSLGIDAASRQEVESLLSQLEQLLVGVAILQDLTPRARDSLVSFGERLSTRIFAAYLRSRGIPARQHDAWELGVTTTDNFGNAEVLYEETTPRVRAALLGEGRTAPSNGSSSSSSSAPPREIPVVTGFLGRGVNTRAVTTLGRGGSDLSATVLGAALRLPSVCVWKDVDGVLTSDPRIVTGASPVDSLTFDEATELAFFGAQVLHPLAMQPAVRSRGSMAVRVRNSYNRSAPGTTITAERDMRDSLVTSIVLKRNVTLLDITSPRMVGQHGFLAAVFDVFRRAEVSVDVVATSEVSVSLTLDPKRAQWAEGEVGEELGSLTYELEKALAYAAASEGGSGAGGGASSYVPPPPGRSSSPSSSGSSSSSSPSVEVGVRQGCAIVSLICNVSRTSEILGRVFSALHANGVNVEMMSQGASKVNISLVVKDAEAGQLAVRCLHSVFFGERGAAEAAAVAAGHYPPGKTAQEAKEEVRRAQR
jgi:aspartate kinase